MVTKKDIVTAVAEKENIPKTLVNDVLNDAIELIIKSLQEEKSVKLAGLGTFNTKKVQKRKQLDKRTGELVAPRPYYVPTFETDGVNSNVEFKEVFGATFYKDDPLKEASI